MNRTCMLCVVMAMGLGGEANAAFIPLPIVSGPDWISMSSDGMQSQAPYPNTLVVPDPATTRAQLMWSRSGPGQEERVNANFGHSYMSLPSEPQPGDQYGAWIAADSAMFVYIIGQGGFAYNLSEHLVDGLPVPIFIDFTSLIQRPDQRYFDIWACDGGTVGPDLILSGCHDDGSRWVFFDAEHGPDQRPSFMAVELPEPANLPGPTTPVPEPSSLSLLALAAFAGWRFRKRADLETCI
jgi:hypothetical protein